MKQIRKEHIKYAISLLISKRHYFTETLNYFLHKDNVLLNGFGKSTNFGDALNIPLVEYLSEKKAITYKYLLNSSQDSYQDEHYTVIGSILHLAQAGSYVWGAGFISDAVPVNKKPKKVFAVRGPLSREMYLNNGIECPEVYGDPALLLPYIYHPQPAKRNNIGIIPHYIDKNSPWLLAQKKNQDVVVIDIETGYNWKHFIDQLLQCRVIITSSLHAVILANAYNIPTIWVSFSDKITGGTFKFRDYYLSVGKQITSPFEIKDNTALQELLNHLDTQPNKIDLALLVDSCPFATDEKKELLKSKIRGTIS